MLKFSTFALLSAALSGTQISGVAAGPFDGRQVWPILYDYLDAAKSFLCKPNTDPLAIIGDRKLRIFWEPKNAPGFDLARAQSTLKDGNSCAIVIYYDMMDARAKEQEWSPNVGQLSYMKPAAIAPLCFDEANQTQENQFPYGDGTESAAIFNQVRNHTEQDAYLVLPVSAQPAPEGVPVDTSCISFRSEQWHIDLQWAGPGAEEEHAWTTKDMLLAWANFFAEAKTAKPGCFPNPYIVGSGDDVWTDWVERSEWGFAENESIKQAPEYIKC